MRRVVIAHFQQLHLMHGNTPVLDPFYYDICDALERIYLSGQRHARKRILAQLRRQRRSNQRRSKR